MTADHVLGVSPASTSLAQLTTRREVGRALDLGTGCGVQSLHLSAHAGVVVATDVNPRALAITAFNAALNEIEVDVRAGSLWDPVAEDAFDLVTTNPPFVISPRPRIASTTATPDCPATSSPRHRPRAPAHLSAGGWCHLLANWARARAGPGTNASPAGSTDERRRFVVERDVLDPA